MNQPVVYSYDEFLVFFKLQTSTLKKLHSVMKKFANCDEEVVNYVRKLLALDKAFGLSFDVKKMRFSFEVDEANMLIMVFYEVPLKILDLDTKKDISRNLNLSGLIINGEHSKHMEIKQIIEDEVEVNQDF